jgi:hypothetical protein
LTKAEAQLSQLTVTDASQISEFELGRRLDCLSYLSAQYNDLGGFDTESIFWGFFPDHLVPGDEVFLKNLFQSSQGWARDFHVTAIELDGILNESTSWISNDTSWSLVGELNKLLERNKPGLPVELVPGFFDRDATGAYSRELIRSFQKNVESYHSTLETVKVALKSEGEVSQAQLQALQQLKKIARDFGFSLGTSEELSHQHDEVERAILALKEDEIKVANFAQKNSIPYDGTSERIRQISKLTQLILEAPIEHLELQTIELTREGAAKSIEVLKGIQSEMIGIGSFRGVGEKQKICTHACLRLSAKLQRKKDLLI